jgi:hypothetical protein
VDESLQQLLALLIVAIVVALELLRRRRRKKAGKASCDGCETGKPQPPKTETPLKFYKRRPDNDPRS